MKGNITNSLIEDQTSIKSIIADWDTGKTDSMETAKDLETARASMKLHLDMLARPKSNNKCDALDLAVFAFALLEDAYFDIVFSDTDSDPITDSERNLRDGIQKARAALKGTFYDVMTLDETWKRVDAVSYAMMS